jgi:hypothetical protein
VTGHPRAPDTHVTHSWLRAALAVASPPQYSSGEGTTGGLLPLLAMRGMLGALTRVTNVLDTVPCHLGSRAPGARPDKHKANTVESHPQQGIALLFDSVRATAMSSTCVASSVPLNSKTPSRVTSGTSSMRMTDPPQITESFTPNSDSSLYRSAGRL